MEFGSSKKRSLKETSPESESSLRNKRHLGGKSSNMNSDTFTWALFEEKMKNMLETVVKKEDIQQLQKCIDDVKSENVRLRKDLSTLKSKIETLEKNSRRSNIVVSGIMTDNYKEAKQEFIDICNNIMQTKVGITRMIKMRTPGDYVVELESPVQATNMMINSGKLKGSNIYIQKDYTPDERTQRYQLRRLKRDLQKYNKHLICTFKDTNLLIGNHSYTWNADFVVAKNSEGKQFLENLLTQTKDKYNIILKAKHKFGNENIEANATTSLTQDGINTAV